MRYAEDGLALRRRDMLQHKTPADEAEAVALYERTHADAIAAGKDDGEAHAAAQVAHTAFIRKRVHEKKVKAEKAKKGKGKGK